MSTAFKATKIRVAGVKFNMGDPEGDGQHP
jgi:hypothetical protein